ncbi:Testis-specific serine/threonine-protein kinase 1 [Papilio xuthus]|uniref:Testis-specific serine/threonine-protein kinase 1 n=1 Tax=Papilio xuthus TaxID=66420 RepID=A0A194Q8W4_PAPXU|nr:Testis-specific serine/threonine-protein kinase 1 [Papilio xuthus]
MTELKSTTSEENTLASKGYKLLKYLGEGAYAKVYLTEYLKENNKVSLACKVIETAKAPKDFVVKFLPREIDVLIRLNHPHLIHVHSIFQRKTKYYIFMRYSENGDLLGYILKNGCVSENQSRVWLRQLALGLQYLHELEITHRDIKSENVLLTANFNVKLSDFGFSRFCIDEDDQPILSETYCGSMSYAAPEILRGKPYLPKPTDLWSLGVVLFVMLNKSMPFDDTRMKKLYEQQMGKKYRFRSRVAGILSLECKSVVKHLLEPDPGLRYNATQILKSEWIAMDSRLTTLNAVEEAALNRAKEGRKRLSEIHKNPAKKQGDIWDDTQRTSSYRVLDNDLRLSGSEQLTLASRGYKIIKKINEGSYAKVYLAEYRNPSKSDKLVILACKVIDTNTAPKDFVKKFLPREIDMLIKLNHPHLVHTHSIFQRRYKYFIFLRFMEHGDLLEYILQNGAVQEDQARIWTRQLSLAIQYMHELEIAHRDIKCENVLLTANKNAKLSDFGFARTCVDKKMKDVHSETFCGSLSYTAPEILHGCPYFPKPTDIWSLGVVVYVMLNRAMPFEDKHIKQLYQAQINRNWRFRSRYADTLSDNCKRLVALMLEPNYQNRIKVEQIISSEWIAMDSRLLEWTPQETLAFKKAKEERSHLQKKLESTELIKNEKESCLPEKSLVNNSIDVTGSTSSW